MADEINEIGILTRRRIEAEIIKPIYDIMKEELGQPKAQEIIERAINAAAIQAGKEMASREKQKTDINSFKAIQHHWTKGNALEIKVIPVSEPQRYDYNVTRCRYAEMYKEMGLEEIGFLLSCNRDSKFIEGYAPNIALTRTQTIMNGYSYCDFRYIEKD